jgi:hypothetical protein
MSWVAAAVGVGSALVANSAAKKQVGAAGDALGFSENQADQAGRNIQPWLATGKMALGDLSSYLGIGAGGFDPNAPGVKAFGLSDFQASPAYNFNLQQGQQAIDKASNARGNFYAPQTLQDISKFSQGLASNEFNNAYNMYNQNQSNVVNRLSNVANAGQNAAVYQGNLGMNAAGQMGNAAMQMGNAQAAGTVGTWGNLLQGGASAYNNYLQNQILNRQQQPTYAIGAGGFS